MSILSIQNPEAAAFRTCLTRCPEHNFINRQNKSPVHAGLLYYEMPAYNGILQSRQILLPCLQRLAIILYYFLTGHIINKKIKTVSCSRVDKDREFIIQAGNIVRSHLYLGLAVNPFSRFCKTQLL